MTSQTKDIETITQNYYDSSDADNFYHIAWGGEDIHIGIYDPLSLSVQEASRKTVATMASMIPGFDGSKKVLDIGAGYGGAARYLAKTFGCAVDCLNLSIVENNRNRKMNNNLGVDHLITVIEGRFELLPFPDAEYDVVWSEDAILHSSDRKKVLEEAARVLKPGGDFIFTDPMQHKDAPANQLQPVYDRIHLEDLGSFEYYREIAEQAGLKKVQIIDLSQYLPLHYDHIHREIDNRYDELSKVCSIEYLTNMKKGLQHWVNFGNKGHLTWGILHFRKP